jgi:myo-inositol-1(or 4)-monophosphatase
VAAGRATAAAIGSFHHVDGLPALLIATEAGAVALPELPAYGDPLLLAAPGAAREAAALWRERERGHARGRAETGRRDR